jgi:transcription initiation factor IIE alpha subunit
MPNITKPGIKDIQNNSDAPGYICDICSVKYRLEEAKLRCQRWHEATPE